MATKTVKFDFFKVFAPKTEEKLLTAAEFMSRLTEHLPNSKSVPHFGNWYRFESFESQDGLAIGSAVKILMQDLPGRARIHKAGIQSLGLQEDEGITGLTYFLYSQQYNALVLQRARPGVAPGPLLNLIERIVGLSGTQLVPIWDVEALHRLPHKAELGKFITRVAIPTSKTAYASVTTRAAATLSEYFKGAWVEVRVIGKPKHPLSKEAVIAEANALAAIHAEDPQRKTVTKLVVFCKNSEEEASAPLDILSGRVVAEGNVEFDSARSLSPTGLRRAIVIAYHEREAELRKYPIIKRLGV